MNNESLKDEMALAYAELMDLYREQSECLAKQVEALETEFQDFSELLSTFSSERVTQQVAWVEINDDYYHPRDLEVLHYQELESQPEEEPRRQLGFLVDDRWAHVNLNLTQCERVLSAICGKRILNLSKSWAGRFPANPNQYEDE